MVGQDSRNRHVHCYTREFTMHNTYYRQLLLFLMLKRTIKYLKVHCYATAIVELFKNKLKYLDNIVYVW
jgi:hypothetical protein